MTDKKYGPDLLLEQYFGWIEGDWGWLFDEALGDSKIEKLLFRSIVIRSECGACEYQLAQAINVEHEQNLINRKIELDPRRPLMIIRAQAQIENRRVDFLIHAFDHNNGTWRRLLVECDGHDYHERTKEQAAKDRSKDRLATLSGYDFFRFTGSEIWRDPWGCASQIGDWAARGI